MSKTNVPTRPAPPLVLASSSPYRRQLLQRLAIPFDTAAPGVDESARPDEAPADLVRRLADRKCAVIAATRPDAVVIASDQLACRGGEILGKPGDEPSAQAQLRGSSGREVSFLTAVTLRIPELDEWRHHLDVTRVLFRVLGDEEIRRYVNTEAPLDCAGSFRCEGLGISLFDRIVSNDPTALTGLPLIWTAAQLREAGYAVP